MLAIHPRGRFARFAIRWRIAVVVLFALLHLRFYLPGPSGLHLTPWKAPPPPAETHNTSGSNDPCTPFTGLERVVITVKTGATEAASRIPVQLRTSLRCAPHVYVFSDMAQKIGDIEIFDSLDETSPAVKDENVDFDIYRKQQELKDPEKIAAELKTMKNPAYSAELASWTLDKYKNMHIVEKSWALKPDMDWYLHIDADTYVILSSLIVWLRKLDASKELFFGAVAHLDNSSFGHGGSGILLSGAASRSFAVTHKGTAARWDPEAHKWCCGDYLFAQALREYNVAVQDCWPTLNGESQSTIPFGSEHWCQPVVTIHHVSIPDMAEMGRFEEQRPNKGVEPLTYQELFMALRANKFPEYRQNWDSMAEGRVATDIGSAEECFKACEDDENCFQTSYNGTKCTLGTKTFLLGVKKDPEDGKKWESSWNTTRIAAWVDKQKPCGKVEFPHEN